MENYLFYLFGIGISCSITSIIIFQFMDEHYEHAYSGKVVYAVLKVGTCLGIMLINLLGIPVLNMLIWILVFTAIGIFLYCDFGRSFLQRIFEIVILILVLSICETVGIIILQFTLWKLNINKIQPEILECIKMTFSKLIIIVLYYPLISRIWKNNNQERFTPAQYFVHFVIIIYSVLNLSVIIVVVSNNIAVSFAERLLLLVNMLCILFADLYFLYFVKVTGENEQLKLKLSLLEQQSDLQYEYYRDQEQKYNESVKILHDVNKHLNMIKGIYESNRVDEARSYANEIECILKPLVLQKYVRNPILNILLNDKKRCASLHQIDFKIEAGSADLLFMEPVEVTTVFGNLLDNAIEACDGVTDKSKFIDLKFDTCNRIVVINLSNSSSGTVKWTAGIPVSQKGKNHGIGLLNVEQVIKKYNGNMKLKEESGIFNCSIIFNQ